MGQSEVEIEEPVAMWIEEDSEVVPGGARLLFQGLADQPVPDLPSGPLFVHNSLDESLGVSQVSQSGEYSHSMRVSQIEKLKRKLKGKQVPNRFIQDLAGKCCQLKST